MGDLVLLFYQVKLLSNSRIILEPILANDEKFLNDVLDPSLYFAFMEDGSKPLKNGIDTGRSCLGEHLATLDHEVSCHLN